MMADFRHYYHFSREEYLDLTEPEQYGLERELPRIKQELALNVMAVMVGGKTKKR